MGKFWALPLAAMVVGISAGFAATPAQADDQAAFHAACLKISPGQEAMCSCLAAEAMAKADPQLRADLILSMAQPAKYTAKAQKGGIPPEEMTRWIDFSSESAAKCHVDN